MTRQEMIDYLHELAYREREYLSVVLDGIEGPCAIAMKLEEAAGMLKEQEPQETRLVHHYSRPGVYADLWLHCEKCGGRIDNHYYKPNYCPECGRKVKWDE